ncbi:acyl-CoA dehydrogenase family protein [Pandoraea sputorum]|uniref:Crotonobetainyl-CoA dehydrogenase n=1 Tax=Pandoraea sputorum TaxID=93222 RepID=A0A239SDA4_9BURK|nr:acyl-CoA dehydrogenase family protein [Pandoraea sputorum]SNU82868.1 Crotonobetainyl-CoA dehydrogenase [Pandoraea sputorum]VVE12921.1 acyl-CoA dehydrogenase [Pandoraea sputorum]
MTSSGLAPSGVVLPLPPQPRGDGPARHAQLDALLPPITRALAESAAALDRDAHFPFDNFALLHRHGLIAEVVPRAAGGGGGGLATARRIVGAVAKGESATALVLTMTYLQHRSLVRESTRWPQAQRHAVFESAVRDGALINALRVEPDLGTPARGGLPSTIARRTQTGWRLSGRKLYCTGIPALRWLNVWARTDEAEPRVGVFLVPRPDGSTDSTDSPDRPGIRVVQNWDHLGLRASASHEVVLEDIDLPFGNAVDIRPPNEWAPAGIGQRDNDAHIEQQAWMSVLLGTLYDAVARAGVDWLVTFLNTRVPGNLGAPLATVPRIQETVGEIAALLHVNQRLLDAAAQAADAGEPDDDIASGALKFTVTGNAIRVLELALQLSGNHGLSRNNPLERYHRDVLCSRIHTPQNDTILGAAGRQTLASFREFA